MKKEMKKSIVLTTILSTILGLTTACASSYTWLDDGATVHSSENNTTTIQSKNASKSTSSDLNVTLATGVAVTLTGGVYVKAKEPKDILDWAQANGYTATQDKYIENAVHIKCTAQKSIDVANLVAKLEGVTTSAPNYKQNLVSK